MLDVSQQGDEVVRGRGEHRGHDREMGAVVVKQTPQDEESWAPGGGRRAASQAQGTARTKAKISQDPPLHLLFPNPDLCGVRLGSRGWSSWHHTL